MHYITYLERKGNFNIADFISWQVIWTPLTSGPTISSGSVTVATISLIRSDGTSPSTLAFFTSSGAITDSSNFLFSVQINTKL